MEFPDEFTSFWSAIVNPGTKCYVEVPQGTECFLTTACVGQEDIRPDEGRISLFAKVNDNPDFLLVPFILNSFESASLDLKFGETDIIIFHISCSNVPVHISGYISGGFHIDVKEVDSSFDENSNFS